MAIRIFQNIREITPNIETTPSYLQSINSRSDEYTITLYDQEHRIRISYLFRLIQQEIGENEMGINTWQLCPNLDHTISIEMLLLGEEIVEDLPNPQYWSIPEDSFGLYMDTEEFVQFFIDNPDGCLNVYANRDQ